MLFLSCHICILFHVHFGTGGEGVREQTASRLWPFGSRPLVNKESLGFYTPPPPPKTESSSLASPEIQDVAAVGCVGHFVLGLESMLVDSTGVPAVAY